LRGTYTYEVKRQRMANNYGEIITALAALQTQDTPQTGSGRKTTSAMLSGQPSTALSESPMWKSSRGVFAMIGFTYTMLSDRDIHQMKSGRRIRCALLYTCRTPLYLRPTYACAPRRRRVLLGRFASVLAPNVAYPEFAFSRRPLPV
jgi:hypothetical protein